MQLVLAGTSITVTEGWSVFVMGVEGVLVMAGECKVDRVEVLIREGVERDDILVVSEERLQKVADINVVLSEGISSDGKFDNNKELIGVEVGRKVVVRVVKLGTIGGTVDD